MEFLNKIDQYKEDIIKSTQETLRIRSVKDEAKENMPFGQGPADALNHFLKKAEEMGFETKNLDNYAGYIEFGEGDETVGILAHLDVVPEGDGWDFDPYGGIIDDDKIYGRGAMDDKGPAVATLYAMKALKDSNTKLNKKVRLILGTDEEAGWGCMDYYFKHEEAPNISFTPDADFPVIHAEKGIIIFDLIYDLESDDSNIKLMDISGGNAPNMVPDYAEALLKVDDYDKFEKKYYEYKNKSNYPVTIREDEENVIVSAIGVSAHGSTPEKGENAIDYLIDFLYNVFPNKSLAYDFLEIYRNRIEFKNHGEAIGCGFEDEVSGKLAFNVGMINKEDNKIIITINVRYPIHSSAEEVYQGISENLKDTAMKLVEGSTDIKPLYVPEDNELVRKLMEVYKEESGDMDAKPVVTGGGTYARALDNAVAFGPNFPGEKELAHQKNEFISVENLMKITRIYTKAIYELAK